LACTFAVFVTFAHAQQIDFAAGGSTVWSSGPTTASQAFPPPDMSGGVYPSASLQYLRANHFGLNLEGAFRYSEATYNGFQNYRPILYDINAVYAKRLSVRMRGDFMGGVGGETVIFYPPGSCGPNGGCRSFVNSTHFLLHAGVGLRIYFWRNFFARPEAHYYFIPNNSEFHSDNVFRLGVSVGYTFGSH
jgi:hypothetical protein